MLASQKVQADERTREFLLVPDLRAWLHPRNLAALIQEVVQKMEDVKWQPVGLPPAVEPAQLGALLTLLTYCYASGIYGSQRIAHQLDEDETLRHLCASHSPDATLLCRFRGENRDVIEQCLAKVSLIVWKTRFGHWQRGRTDQEADSLPASSHRMDPLFHGQISFEVRERLNRAERQDQGLLNLQMRGCLGAER